MNFRIIKILIIFVGFSVTAFSQTKSAIIDAALDAIEKKDYHAALIYYSDALEFDTTNTEILYRTAESARNFNSYKQASDYYNQVIEFDGDGDYPLAQYYAGEMLQRMGKYDDAITAYELYRSQYGSAEDVYDARAAKEIEACNWSISMQDKTAEHITVTNLGQGINSPYSEFGAYAIDDELYYSSLRFDDPSADKPNSTLISKILKTDSENLGQVLEGDINDNLQIIGHTAFNMNKTRLYYTICEYSNSTDIRCDIYYRTISDDGIFGESIMLPEQINAIGATNTQPSIAFDAENGREILYFVSNREGGEGKLDIYYSIIESGDSYGTVTNLSAVNTAEDEMTPFYQSEGKTLYFSSDGYLGLGGLDVYRADNTEGGFVNIENLGLPINSSYNDLYYTLNGLGDVGHISSNRLGSAYLESSFEACCYDIYKVDIEEFDVEFNALTFNKLTSEELNGATVRIIDVVTGEEVYSITNPTGNDHTFTLKSGREYTVIAEKDGYSSDEISLSTKNLKKGETITKKLYLEPQNIILDVLTFDKSNNDELNGVTVILENLSDPSKIDVIRLNELGNDFRFELEPCQKYKITAARDGFEAETIIIDTCDPNIGSMITKKLFLGKPNLNIYLPVSLYFDNDHPDPRSKNLYTSQNYSATYFPYYAKKSEFIDKYSGPMKGDLKYTASQELESFFEQKVKGEYNKLQTFLEKLLERLRNGESFEVSIKGYTSPKSTNKYNLALGQRRVYSIRNEMTDYGSGSFETFIESGKLILTDVSFGEELSPTGISDSHSNVRKSIYSVEASEERKAQIVSVRKLN